MLFKNAYSVDSLIGGYDDYENKAFLGSVDHLGSGVAEQVVFVFSL